MAERGAVEPLAVVVVTHNSAAVVGDLLDSLSAGLDGVDAQVVVVDNASSDDTRAVVRARGDVRLLECDNRGYSAGINAGVSALDTRGPVVVLNPDLRLDPGCLRTLEEEVRRPGVGITAPRLLNEDRTLAPSIRRTPTLWRAAGLGFTGISALSEPDNSPASHLTPQTVDWTTGAALVVARECHEALGGWDESFFLYSEETDFCLRARDAGFATRYVPNAVAVHIGAQSGASPRIYSMQIVNRVRLYARRHGALASWSFLGLSVLREAVHSLRGDLRSREALRALLSPRLRPAELGCSEHLLPR